MAFLNGLVFCSEEQFDKMLTQRVNGIKSGKDAWAGRVAYGSYGVWLPQDHRIIFGLPYTVALHICDSHQSYGRKAVVINHRKQIIKEEN